MSAGRLARRRLAARTIAVTLAMVLCASALGACGAAGRATAPSPSSTALLASAAVTMPVGLDAVSCEASLCAAGGDENDHGYVWVRHNGGTWRSEQLPPAVDTVVALSCPSGGSCVALGSEAGGFVPVVLWSGPAGWSVPLVWTSSGSLESLACPSARVCVAVGSAPAVVTDDGGVTWHHGTVPPGLSGPVLQSVSCSSATRCWAVGYQLLGGPISGMAALLVMSVDGGRTWVQRAVASDVADLDAVSCTGAGSCVATGVGHSGQPVAVRSSDGGSAWSRMRLPSELASVAAISCGGNGTCWMAGSAAAPLPGSGAPSGQASYGMVARTMDGGATWSAETVRGDRVAAFEAMSCVQADRCTLVGSNQDETGGSIMTTTAARAAGDLEGVLPRPDPVLASPGASPLRVLLAGDSTALDLGVGLLAATRNAGVELSVNGLIGCGVMGAQPTRVHGVASEGGLPQCATWRQSYASSVASDRPEVVLLLVGRWETLDRMIDGTWMHLGEPAFDAVLEEDLREAITVLGGSGAHVIALSTPYNVAGEAPGGGHWPEDDPARVDAFNRVLAQAVAASGGHASLFDFHDVLSPHGSFARVIGGIPVRTRDGIHYSVAGGAWLSQVLLPAARRAAGP